MDCIFCKIIGGEIPSEFVYQDEELVAFRDISPLAPVHILIVPKKHIGALTDLTEADIPLMGQMVKVANQLAKSEGVAESGYRLAINCGKHGRQFVPHLHMHLLGGKKLADSPA